MKKHQRALSFVILFVLLFSLAVGCDSDDCVYRTLEKAESGVHYPHLFFIFFLREKD